MVEIERSCLGNGAICYSGPPEGEHLQIRRRPESLHVSLLNLVMSCERRLLCRVKRKMLREQGLTRRRQATRNTEAELPAEYGIQNPDGKAPFSRFPTGNYLSRLTEHAKNRSITNRFTISTGHRLQRASIENEQHQLPNTNVEK